MPGGIGGHQHPRHGGLDGIRNKQDLANFIWHTLNWPPNLRGQITRNLLGLADLTTRVTTLEGQNLDTRLSAVEGWNAGSRLTTLEGQNLNTRLTAAEGDITSLQSDVASALSRIGTLENPHQAHVTRTTPYTATASTDNYIDFGSERYDLPDNDQHSNSSNTARLTCKRSGTYLIIGVVEWERAAAANIGDRRAVWIQRDDSGGGSTEVAKVEESPLKSGDQEGTVQKLTQCVAGVTILTANDFVRLGVYHDHPSTNLDIHAVDDYSPEFMMVRVGPAS